MKYIIVTFSENITKDQINAFKRTYELDDHHEILSGHLFRVINNSADMKEVVRKVSMDDNVVEVKQDTSHIKKNCI